MQFQTHSGLKLSAQSGGNEQGTTPKAMSEREPYCPSTAETMIAWLRWQFPPQLTLSLIIKAMIQGSSLHLLQTAPLDFLAKVLIAGSAVKQWLQLCGKSNARASKTLAVS